MKTTVTVDRAKWSVAGLDPYSALLVPDSGRQCCLGFVCAIVYPGLDLNNEKTPETLLSGSPPDELTRLRGLVYPYAGQDTDITAMMIRINDDTCFPLRAREVVLADLLETYTDYRFEFTGEYPAKLLERMNVYAA